MKAQILFEDTQRIAAERGKFEKALTELNRINDFLNEHQIGPLSADLVHEYMRDPKTAIRGIFAAKIPDTDKYTGLRNDKSKMLEAMQLPTPPPVTEFPYTNQVIGLLYVFDFGKKIVLNTARFESYLNNFRFVTDDPRIIEAFEDFQALAEMLEKINDKLHFIPLNGLNSINFDYRLGDVIAFTKRGFEIQQRGFQIAVGLLRR